jgi:hypothetical protein
MSYPDEWNPAPQALTERPFAGGVAEGQEAFRLGRAFQAWREWALSVPEIAAQDAGAKAYALLGEAIELTALPESLEEMADLAGVLSNACPSLWALAEAMEEKLAINRQRTFTARVFGGQVRHVEREGAKE